MVQKTNQAMNTLLSHRTQLSQHGNKDESILRINWLIKKDTAINDRGLRENHHILKNNNHNPYVSNIPLKALLHKEIDLQAEIHNKSEKQNHPMVRISSNASSQINSRKASEERKQKLSVVSKRNSLRKITDFISFPSKENKRSEVMECFKMVENNNGHDLWDSNENIPQKLQNEMVFEGEQKKKKIRISLKRESDKNVR